MFSWFRKNVPIQNLTVPEGLAALSQHGISKHDDVTLEDISSSIGGRPGHPMDYVDLLCALGGESKRRRWQHRSDDIWHFDTECICEDGDYVSIAKRLLHLSKGALGISSLADHVDVEASEAWIEFDHHGLRMHWDLEVDNDWVDAAIFTKFVSLFAATSSEARFTYGNLGGQDCLIGFSTEAQRKALSSLTRIEFVWLE